MNIKAIGQLRSSHSNVTHINLATATHGELMKKRLALLFIPVLILGAFALLNRVAAADATPRRVEISATRFAYTPGEITLKKNEPVVLVLKSTDVAHGIKFKELNVEVKVSKGGTGQVQFTPTKSGTFVGHCSVFCGSGHGKMALTLNVVE
jgi:cytochrome c oxidase subunit II